MNWIRNAITTKDIETVIKKIPQLKNVQSQTFKHYHQYFYSIEYKKKDLFFLQSQHYLDTKAKDPAQNEHYRPLSPMNMDAKFPNKNVCKLITRPLQKHNPPRLSGLHHRQAVWLSIWKSIHVMYHIKKLKDGNQTIIP